MDLRGERISNKSYWKGSVGNQWVFYCPNCAAERRAPYRPRPGNAMHFFRVGLTTAALMLASWPWFGWKGVVWYLPVWMAFESVYRLRLRAIMSCSQCGFDPYLYLTGLKRARAAIDAHWRQKFQERGIPFPGDEASSRAEVAQSAGDQKIEARKTTPRVINPKQRAEVQRSLGLDA